MENEGVIFIPKVSVLRTIQDKAEQKKFFMSHHFDVVPFICTESFSDFWKTKNNDLFGSTVVCKSRKTGYDGKGVWIIDSSDENIVPDDAGPFIVERFIPSNKIEISIIVAKDNKKTVVYDPGKPNSKSN